MDGFLFVSVQKHFESVHKKALRQNRSASVLEQYRGIQIQQRLTFAELWCTTCFFQTVFLTLFSTGITCNVTGCLQGRTEVSVGFHQGTSDAVTDSASLTGVSAAVYVHENVELIQSVGQFQGGFYNHLKQFRRHVFSQRLFVYYNVSCAGT